MCNIIICSSQRPPLCFVYLIIIIITDECLLISRLRGRVPWAIFRDSVERSACETESRRMTFVGDEEWRWTSGEAASLSGERGTALALPLYGTRSKTRDTTSVARYISKVKDPLLCSPWADPHSRLYHFPSTSLYPERDARSLARVGACNSLRACVVCV